MEIGARLFAERPFNDVWIEEVAKEAGVSRGLVYHYFPNKRDFFSAIVMHGLEDAFEISTPDPSVPPDRWLIDGIDSLFTFAAENANAFRAIYTSRHVLDDEVIEAVEAGRELQIVRIAQIVSPGEEPSEALRISMKGWTASMDELLLSWLDGRLTDRDKVVRIVAGQLAGAIVTALMVDGRGERVAELGALAPSIYKD